METGRNSGNEDRRISSAEYRAKLLTKLNCLIAVLEVAIAKIARSMELPGARSQRLLKIQSNLENTLSICNRAKTTLEKDEVGGPRTRRVRNTGSKMSYRDYVELSSIEEYQKFKSLPPIKPNEINSANVDALIERLMDS